ncbi:MAG: heavy metal translocating P-type ATPase [Bacteroidota bacterium]|nr:heavy metal translocating P-type ATPase [Candidatus Kapabacteria bacterium]MDW8272255.1 heavy metal translocating P-type ATPase [Bacteroidota bacterium]
MTTTTAAKTSAGATLPTVVETFPVVGITCAACARSIESLSRSVQGVYRAEVNSAAATVTLEYDPLQVQPDDVAAVLRPFGYELVHAAVPATALAEAAEREQHIHRKMRNNAIGAACATLPAVALAMSPWHMERWAVVVSALSATIAVIGFGRDFFIRAWSQVRTGALAMDTLVALSTGIAWGWSMIATVAADTLAARGIEPHVYFESAATIVTFILVGKYLEHRARLRTNAALTALVALQPQVVHRVEDGQTKDVPLAEVQRGDWITVLPGERIPVDGIVLDGHSWIDEQMLSGESLPVEKGPGSRVYAGTLNGDGTITIEARAVGAGTFLGSMIRAVERAQSSKPPIQQLADRIAAVFVPVVLVIAALTLAGWILLAPDKASTLGLLSVISVLVVACPCALGLATPTAIAVALGRAARQGIYVRDGRAFEALARVQHVVFDKTGTLTRGQPSVVEARWYVGEQEHRYVAFIQSVLQRSTHPLSRALAQWLGGNAEGDFAVEQHRGLGLRGWNAEHTLLVGNRAFLEQHGVALPPLEEIAASEVLVALDGKLIFAAWLRDRAREDAAATIRMLREHGITTHLVSGDRRQSAEQLAAELDIEHVYAPALPHQKQEYIRSLRTQSDGAVVMVGDGINDAPALAEADTSIALGTGSDVAVHAADVTIVGEQLMPIVHLLALSRRLRRTIRQNFAWAFLYNLALIPIAAGVLYPVAGILLHPMFASIAMAASSISVVTNSLRLQQGG